MIKKISILAICYFLTCAIILPPLFASNRPKISNRNRSLQSKKVNHNLGVGIRFHREHSHFERLPFSDGDKTYTLSYEYHEGIGYWLIGVGFTPELKENKSIEKIITPQLSLVLKDRIYRAGVGIMKSYISDKDEIVEDTDIYYQFNLGISVPVFNHFSIDINSLYTFEKWRDIKFKFEDVEYGVIVNYTF